jgi:hypothetical protein
VTSQKVLSNADCETALDTPNRLGTPICGAGRDRVLHEMRRQGRRWLTPPVQVGHWAFPFPRFEGIMYYDILSCPER